MFHLIYLLLKLGIVTASEFGNSLILEAVLPPSVNLYNTKIQESDESLSEEIFPGDPLTPDDFANGIKLTEQDIIPPNNNSILQAFRYFEGDILLKDIRKGRNAIRDERSKWLGGRIPYVISQVFDSRDRSVIARSFQEFHDKSCIRFVPRSEESDYIYLTTGQGCYSLIGRSGGKQPVSLGNGCMYVGVVIHELLHAVGFWHEQSRADRDDYVTILWDNIIPDMRFNFAKYTLKEVQHLGEEYDYESVMHYENNAFGKNPSLLTIIAKKPGVTLGQRRGFSDCDLRKVNRLYQCDLEPGPEVKPEESKCVNNDKKCGDWAKKGECKKNPKWMLQYCGKACKICGKKSDCEDKSEYCGYWAEKGECEKNPKYMLPICPASCNQCKLSLKLCKDKNKSCEEWASKGYCDTYKAYMSSYCQRSCDICN